MATIAELIERNREQLLTCFTEEAGKQEPTRALVRDELIDTLPEYLDALSQLSRDWEHQGAALKKKRLEATHISHRLRVGYNQEEATAEYLLLGHLLSGLWEPLPPEEQPAPADKQRLFDELQQAMDHVVAVFSGYTVADRQAEKRTLRQLDALAQEQPVEALPAALLSERLAPLLSLLQEAMGADAAVLMLVDASGQRLVPTASTGQWPPELWRGAVTLDSATFVARVAASDEPVYVPDAAGTRLRVDGEEGPSDMHSLLGVRMWPYGRLLGVVCIGLMRTRAFEPRARRYFEVLVEHLAGIVERMLLLREVRAANARLRESEARYRLASHATSDAVWDWDLLTGTLLWSEGVEALLGYPREELEPTERWWLEHLHPEDRQRVVEGLRAITSGPHNRWKARYRFRRRDGGDVELAEQGLVERDAAGRAVRVVGTVRDVTGPPSPPVVESSDDEARRRFVMESTGLGTWDFELRTGEAHFDERTRALFGVAPDVPITVEELILRVHPEDRERMRTAIRQAMHPGSRGAYSLEYRTVELPGVGTRWVGAQGRTFFDASGQPLRFLGTVADITGRVREREATQRERLRVTNILESISDAFMTLDAQWRFTFINREAERLMGSRREELLGRNHWEVFPATLDTPLEHHYRRVAAERVPLNFENHYAPWNRWFELRVYPTEEGIAVYFHDITEKKRGEAERDALLREQTRLREEAERALRERQRAMEVLEHGDALCVLDRHFRIVLVNENQERLSRTRRQDTLGRDFWEVFPATANPTSRYWTEYHRVVEQRVPARFDEYYAPLDLWTSISAYPTSEGGVAVFFRDVSEEKRAEQFRERLLGIVSHDLRNPLGNISVTTQLLLRREELPDFALSGVRRIATSAERMQRMISDLLDFTQATLGGGIPLARRPTGLCELVQTTLEELELQHPGRLALTCARDAQTGEWDPDRLAQVVSNLVSNALAYGARGTPVEVHVWEEGPDSVLSVRNQGEPIAREQLPGIFDPFKRATHEGNRRGLGLGLYIVQQLVLAHGGTLTVRSTREQGTTFTVRLPRVR